MTAAALVRLARQGELAEGQKIIKETHGRKILLARTRGQVYATDAHCFHMGGNLWEGDIEDIDGHACVVCPLHRYKIDMATGHKVDTMLDGCVTCSSSQQQRTYRVHADPEFIWIDIPELHTQAPLPSDRYNQVALPQAAPGGTPGRANYGLFGASSRQQEGLAPYSGMQRMVPGTPSKAGDEDGPAVLSQEAAVQLSQEAPQQPAQPASQHSFSQGFIPFSQSRADTASIARRKAATAAIAARSYMPPMAQGPPAPARGLAGPSTAAQQAAPKRQQQAAPQRTGSGLARSTSGQPSLFDFGFTVQARAAAAATAGGPEDMDMS